MDTQDWLSFVPSYIAQALIENPNPLAIEKRLNGIILFADIAGFTLLSEELAGHGKVGSEELTNLLNLYFEPMIEQIETCGGIVAKFGGDALTALFIIGDEETKSVANRAISCAMLMQNAMPRYQNIQTSAGTFSLTMKVGLAVGDVLATNVGIPENKLEHILAGQVLDQAAQAEHLAQQAEIVCHNNLLPYLGEFEVKEPRTEQFSCLMLSATPVMSYLPTATSVASANDKILMNYLHPTIVQRLENDQAGFINEHRKVTVLFSNFTGFDYDHDETVVAKLQSYLSQVIATVQSYGGYLAKVDMGDKGSKYIAVFGTPIAHEDDEERAISCAWRLAQIAKNENIGLQTGINTGLVYCGLVGSKLRQEYTVMGEVVNVAARLMQNTHAHQILVSQLTQNYIEDFNNKFIANPLPDLQVKGKTKTVGLVELQGLQTASLRLAEPQYTLPMIGRKAELNQLKQILVSHVLNRQGQIIGLTGEAGIGKSRLVSEAIKLVASHQIYGYGAECQSYSPDTGYLVWQPIWRSFFGLPTERDALKNPTDQIQQKLKQALNELDPSLLPRLPLLATLLKLPIPDNEVTASLDSKVRKEALEALLLDCLRLRCRQNPLLIVLEDCHWIDALSLDLLIWLGRNIADLPVLILLTYRPPSGAQPAYNLKFAELDYFTELPLGDFSLAEAKQFIQVKLRQLFDIGSNDHQITQLSQALLERTGGNPFYIEELLSYLHGKQNLTDDDQIVPQIMTTLANEQDLPDSLQGLILSRIDQLSETEKSTLKLASVIGRVFRASWLWEAYEPSLVGQPNEVKTRLSQLSNLDLTPLDKPEPELEYLFKHIVTHSVVYESLAYNTRAYLHEQIGHYLERVYQPKLEQYVDLLAYHFEQSNNLAKKCEYLIKAGQYAQTSFANAAAISYYQRVLALLEDARAIEIGLRLGEVLELTGKWSEANNLYQKTLELANKFANKQAECQRALGMLVFKQGEPVQALQLLETAQASFEAIADEQGVSQLLMDIGHLYRQRGDYSQSKTLLEQALADYKKRDDKAGTATALYELGLVHFNQGDYHEAMTSYEESLTFRRATGDRLGVANLLHHMGVVALRQGDYNLARPLLEENLTIRQQIGDKPGLASALNAVGLISLTRGEFDLANKLFKQCLATHREIGSKSGIATATGNLGEVYHHQGKYEAAQSHFEESLALHKALNNKQGVGLALNGLGVIALTRFDYQEAQTHLEEALVIRRTMGDKLNLSISLNNLGNTALYRGDYEQARAYFNESLVLAQQINTKLGLATSYACIGALAYQEKDYSQAESLFRQSLNLSLEINSDHLIGLLLLGLMEVAVEQAEFEKAGRMAGKAEQLLEQSGAKLYPISILIYEAAFKKADQATAVFRQAFEEGRQLKLAQII